VNWLPAAAQVPTMLVWGSRDPIIPVQHAHRGHELILGSQLVIFPGGGHFPHHQDPARFADLVVDFVRGLRPSTPQAAATVPAGVTAIHDRVSSERRAYCDRRVTRDRRVANNATVRSTSAGCCAR
jgi:hypothetical protein